MRLKKSFTAEIAETAEVYIIQKSKDKEGFAELSKTGGSCHSGQAKCDPESRFFKSL